MAAFSDLPNELLYDILQLAMPEDLENFAQISKRVQAVARPLLQTHRALIRKYHSFDNDFFGRHPGTLFEDILATPRIAHYFREARVSLLGFWHDRKEYTEQEVERLCELTADSNYFLPDMDTTAVGSWQNDIKKHRLDAAVPLLLLLLPNLETLELHSYRSSMSWIRGVLGNVFKAANPYLTKLARVCITSYQPGVPLELYLERRRRCAALLSVKEFSAPVPTCKSEYWGIDRLFLHAAEERLELRDSVHQLGSKESYDFLLDRADPFKHENLFRTLEDFPGLEAFSYSASSSDSFSALDGMLNAWLIKGISLATVKTTLRTLKILGRTNYSSPIRSLRDFEVLTELHVNWPLLILKDCDLQAVLPASLRDLQLNDPIIHHKDIYKRLITNALSDILLGVLHLKHITLKTPGCKQLNTTYRYLQHKCREEGLILSVPSPM